ncbi:MAG: hypothetical protein JKY37_05380 [Nannocystaceae bacterium]|nr:hypothetical protein [Nannocystaceae bacterium]
MSKLSLSRLVSFVALYGVALGVGATVASSCIGVNYPTVAFRCNPRQSDNCPETHYCCADDPAAVDGLLPNYLQKDIGNSSSPYFSGVNNGLGTSGMCVNRDDIPTGSGLLEPIAANCPIPCNPTWVRDEIDIVCGATRVCCQTGQLEAADCVRDDEGEPYRPVNGADIGGLTDWNAAAHATHQDAAGIECTGIAMGDQTSDAFLNCIAQLTVADQRGFCMALEAGQVCPTEKPTYVDACTVLNGGGGEVPPQ